MIVTGTRCQCPACGLYFNSTSAFEMHRTGEYRFEPPDFGRKCLMPAAMGAKGMVRNRKGYWLTEKRGTDAPRNGSRTVENGGLEQK